MLRRVTEPRARFAGVHPVLHTPFGPEPDQAVLHEELGALVEAMVEAGVQGVVALGLASEAPMLTEEERDAICGTVTRVLAGRLSLTVGIDGATAVAVDRARRAVGQGASALMVIPPQGASTPELLVEHFGRVAEAAGAPVLVQDAPQVTGVVLEADVLERMAEAHPLVRSVKVEGLAAGPKISRLAAAGLEVMAGWGGLHYPESLQRGAVGCMPGCDLAPALLAVHEAGRAGDREAAERVYRAILPLLAYETQSLAHLVLGEKRALHRGGLFTHEAMRAPAPSLDARQCEAFDALFDRLAADGVPGPWSAAR
jgi:4-hydroxy-tetrahydrodipicolinate synthase